MHAYTHAWIACMAIKRLNEADLSDTWKSSAEDLVNWFRNNNDGVIPGAWYPDAVFKDNRYSHGLKMSPSTTASNTFKYLPTTYLCYNLGRNDDLHNISFEVDRNTNLPDRCESIYEATRDHLKMRQWEEKGSPLTPTNNHCAALMFMLSHYVADGHVPFHCDVRKFSDDPYIHYKLEEEWEKLIEDCYDIDEPNQVFKYDSDGFPIIKDKTKYDNSLLLKIEDHLKNRRLQTGYGYHNGNVWDFMSSLCQYSYILSYKFIPQEYDHNSSALDGDGWKDLGDIKLEELSIAVLSDSIDSLARIWLHLWKEYRGWLWKRFRIS